MKIEIEEELKDPINLVVLLAITVVAVMSPEVFSSLAQKKIIGAIPKMAIVAIVWIALWESYKRTEFCKNRTGKEKEKLRDEKESS